MGKDTIQLENAVSTISQEYLLEFTSEYGIPEDLHPELLGPEDTIVDFSGVKSAYTPVIGAAKRVFPTVVDWRMSAPKDGMPTTNSYSAANVTILDTRRTPIQKQPEALLCLVGLSRRYFLGDDVYPTFLYDDDRDMDLFNLISAPNPTKVKIRTRPRAAHEVPLLTVTVNHVIDMEDPVVMATSSETPPVMEKSPLYFSSKDPPPMITNKGETEDHARAVVSQEVPSAENIATTEVVSKVNLEKEIATMRPPINKKRRKRDQSAMEANAPPKVLRKDHASVHPTQDTCGGESLTAMGVVSDSVLTSSKGTATEIPTEGVATIEVNVQFFVRSPESGRSISQPGWGVTNDFRLDTPEAYQDMVDHTVPPGYFSELRHLPNIEFLAQYNVNLARQVALGSQLKLRFEQEVRLLKKARAQVARRNERIQVREEEIKRLGEEVESLKVVEAEVHGLRNQTKNLETLLEAEVDMKKATKAKNAELAKELESLREERIKVVFKEFKKYEDNKVEQRCAEMDARPDKISVDIDEELYPHMLTAIAGRHWVIGHGLRLAVMKYAESTEIRQVFANVVSVGLAKGMSEGLKYGIKHRKAGRDLADVEAYDPEANNKLVKTIQDLKDLKYLMVDQLEKLKDAPIEVSLEDAIATNISRAEKKKKCRVVCRTHGIGFAHHARSDGIPVSVPTVVPQGLAILLADTSMQTQRTKDEVSPRLLRSKSLPPMYNLDWP
ncbi:hypothetical protein Tco_0526001 [Tanacetum coccineum]